MQSIQFTCPICGGCEIIASSECSWTIEKRCDACKAHVLQEAAERVSGVSPFVIDMMLACYVSPDPKEILGHQRWNSRVGAETRTWLTENELINSDLRATKRGERWVEAIVRTPLPAEPSTRT